MGPLSYRNMVKYGVKGQKKVKKQQKRQNLSTLEINQAITLSNFICFCLDKISFRRDYKSCQVGVVVVRRLSLFVVPQLWELCDGITSVILELHFWDLVHCLLISFCFGSEILKKIGPPQPPKKTKKPQKKTYGFSRWDILPTL